MPLPRVPPASGSIRPVFRNRVQMVLGGDPQPTQSKKKNQIREFQDTELLNSEVQSIQQPRSPEPLGPLASAPCQSSGGEECTAAGCCKNSAHAAPTPNTASYLFSSNEATPFTLGDPMKMWRPQQPSGHLLSYSPHPDLRGWDVYCLSPHETLCQPVIPEGQKPKKVPHRFDH